MKKYLILLLSILVLTGIFHAQDIFAQRDDEANKHYLDAYNLYKLGKLDDAREKLEKVIEINPDHAEAHFGMGSIYFRQNMFDHAIKEFTKVTRIKPKYVEAYQRLWLAYKKLGMNDKAEEELQKYKKLIEERMQAMGGGSPQVVKPVSPPKQKEEEEQKPEPKEARQPETIVLESKPSEARPAETKPKVVKPVERPPEKIKPSVVETKPSRAETKVAETKPAKKKPVEKKPDVLKPVEPPRVLRELESATKIETEYQSPYIKVDKSDPAYKHLFKPLKKMGASLFRNPLKKSIEKWQKSFTGKLVKILIYYVVIVQVWLCAAAFLCIYFRKTKKKKEGIG